MHYHIGLQVYGGYRVSSIVEDPKDKTYNIYIQKGQEVLHWKKFNDQVGISVEYSLEY